MIDKELIELQKGCKATSVVIQDENYNELEPAYSIDAKINENHLFSKTLTSPFFKEELDEISKKGDIAYFVIRGIDEISEELQNEYIGIVKDRELGEYVVPQNVIFVFTVKDKQSLNKISKELYHFCVVAF